MSKYRAGSITTRRRPDGLLEVVAPSPAYLVGNLYRADGHGNLVRVRIVDAATLADFPYSHTIRLVAVRILGDAVSAFYPTSPRAPYGGALEPTLATAGQVTTDAPALGGARA